MDHKEQAEMVAAVVAAGEMMLLKQAGLDHTVTTVARMLEAGPIRSALAAVGQVKLAQPELLAARQVKAAMVQPVVSQGLLSLMLAVAVVLKQPTEVVGMEGLAAVARETGGTEPMGLAAVAAVNTVPRPAARAAKVS